MRLAQTVVVVVVPMVPAFVVRTRLLSLERVAHGGFKRALRNAEHLRADANATLVERLDRVLVAVSLLCE